LFPRSCAQSPKTGRSLSRTLKNPSNPRYKNCRRTSCESPVIRGHGESNGSLWYTVDLEEFVERDHPLRAIKRMVDEALRGRDGDFCRA
jgi:hypothetical protein